MSCRKAKAFFQGTNTTTMAATAARHVMLAKSLPPRLIRFFERFPPIQYSKSALASSAALSSTTTPRADAHAHSIGPQPDAKHLITLSNPFQRHRHPVTGRLHEPMYSLRRQADLVKMAREHGIEDLLPPTVKGTEEQLAYRTEHGIRVRGTGVGRRVKGHWLERTLRARLDKRRQAMLDMPKLIYQWKQVSGRPFSLQNLNLTYYSSATEKAGRSTPNRRGFPVAMSALLPSIQRLQMSIWHSHAAPYDDDSTGASHTYAGLKIGDGRTNQWAIIHSRNHVPTFLWQDTQVLYILSASNLWCR